MGRRMLFAGLLMLAAAGWFLMPLGASTPAQAATSLLPDDCVCAAGLVIDPVTGSRLVNCQCGAMQCVVVSGSGQLQCR